MIHIIYVYFIINAFFAGERLVWDKWKWATYLFLFGSVHYVISILFAIVKTFIERKTWIIPYYRLWFTDIYKDATPIPEVFQDKIKNGTFFERIFLKKAIRKYNHVIIKKEVKP